MKQLINRFKANKLLTTMSIITIISFILGILLISILSDDNKDLITTSVTVFFDVITNDKINYKSILFRSMTNNLLLNILIWLLGISIIGIPIVIIILMIKSFICSFTMISIIYTYKFMGIFKALIYIIPHIMNLFIMFILVYYSVSFSINLFNYLFRKKEVNRKVLVTRYIKLLIFTTTSLIISSLIETYLVPLLISLI